MIATIFNLRKRLQVGDSVKGRLLISSGKVRLLTDKDELLLISRCKTVTKILIEIGSQKALPGMPQEICIIKRIEDKKRKSYAVKQFQIETKEI